MPHDPTSRETPRESRPPAGTTVPAGGADASDPSGGGPARSASAEPTSLSVPGFELIDVLGEGAAGKVYLARQLSLERLVALKVCDNVGGEARTLARLEHPSIVQVFSEDVDPLTNRRLLCIQYVPGTTLESAITELRRLPTSAWSGATLLDVVDRLSTQPAALDPRELEYRKELGDADAMETVCLLGVGLAEALDHAHARGILHRDVKPANVLLNRYGRPLLADFSVARAGSRAGGTPSSFGGTFPYMSPEHLEAFDPSSGVAPDDLDERADLYSLGVVLFELTTGGRPFRDPPGGVSLRDAIWMLIDERRQGPRSPGALVSDVPPALERAVSGALEPERALRPRNAGELARLLEGALTLRRIERALPVAGRWLGFAERSPFLAIILLAVLPHVLGSAVNITYNAVRAVASLDEVQRAAFPDVVLAYNAIAYPVCLSIAVALLVGPAAAWKKLRSGRDVSEAVVRRARRGLLRMPLWAVALAAAGWLPGGVVFPWVLDAMAGPIPASVFGHFIVSFTLAGLIASTYSFFGLQLVTLRVLYPSLWTGSEDLRSTPVAELGGVERRTRWFQLLAGLIPLTGAALLVGLGPETLSAASYATFRCLVMGLMALGAVGFGLAILASNRTAATTRLFLRPPRSRVPRPDRREAKLADER